LNNYALKVYTVVKYSNFTNYCSNGLELGGIT